MDNDRLARLRGALVRAIRDFEGDDLDALHKILGDALFVVATKRKPPKPPPKPKKGK